MTEYKTKLHHKGREYYYTDLKQASKEIGGDLEKIPYSIRILLRCVPTAEHQQTHFAALS